MSVFLDAVGLETILDWIVGGMSQAAVCRKLGITPLIFQRWVRADPERERRVTEARVWSAEGWMDKGEDAIDNASSPLEVSIAKEKAHHCRKMAAIRNPRDYSDRKQISGPNEGPIAVDATVKMDAGEAYKRLLGAQ